jgi:integrase
MLPPRQFRTQPAFELHNLKPWNVCPAPSPAGRDRDRQHVTESHGHMPKKRNKEQIVCPYLTWLLGERNGVFFADGRSNRVDAGRHSLGTRDRNQALENLKQLDRVRAVELGLADSSILNAAEPALLDLNEGKVLYLNHVARPLIAGGADKKTQKRYRAVFEKFVKFALEIGVVTWNAVNKNALTSYAAWLDGEGYAYATEYLELNTLKQAIKWFVEEGYLPPSALIRYPLAKPSGTDTYCYKPVEVAAILDLCRKHSGLNWLADIVTALACTGLRISELAALRWEDLDADFRMLRIADERHSRRRSGSESRRTKTGRSRVFPVHPDFAAVLTKMTRSSDGVVFHGPLSGRVKADTVRRILVRDVLEKLKDQFPTAAGAIGFEHGRLHSFRHYFCSVAAQAGTAEQTVMSWLGHSSSKMVRHYFHLHDDESRRQMKRISFLGDAGGRVAVGERS